MTRLDDSRIALLLMAFAVALMVTAGSAKADFIFGRPQDLGLGGIGFVSLAADDLELYFTSDQAGGLGYEDIWVSTRQSTNDPWGPPVNLQTVNSPYRDAFSSISPDGLTLYFSDYFYGPDRPGGRGGHDLWMSTRASRSAQWSTPVNMGEPFSSPSMDVAPTISRDGLTFLFGSDRPGGSGTYDLWMSTRPTVQDPWGAPVNMGPQVNSGSQDYYCSLSPDGLVLFFESNRSGAYDSWMTRRRSLHEPWEPPVRLCPPLYTPGPMGAGAVSADGRILYKQMSAVPIVPVVDFDGDGAVALGDLLAMIESWGQNDPAIDIGPYPWGDGIVDAKDLEVLMSYWGQEIPNPALIAYWKLNEAEGLVALDSIGANDGTLIGGPVWQPTGGKLGGALQFDGVDDCVTTEFVCDPSGGAFSVSAWVKGGGPGQVILSQDKGANWLLAAAPDGALMTGLTSGRGGPLASAVVITDGTWHRVAFVRDGSNRILYVDDIEVSRDTVAGLSGSTGGLHIGAGKDLAPGTFWSGLIDDVRIYDRAVTP